MQQRDAGRLALDDPLDAPARHPGRRGDSAPTAGPRQRPATRAGRRLVGARRGHGPGHTAGRADADKIAHPPHFVYHYSNLAYGLLGAMLERTTGTPWADLLTERLLTPLGMRRTTYTVPAVRPRLRRAPLGRDAAGGAAYRHRRDGPAGSSGRLSRIWAAGRRSWPTRTRRCSPRPRSPRCARPW
ncbi:serine hydrolase domain-containing protein [Micromonospora sp. b486]|uniref:serine hydrolase domain-containing protein n=1 Tax=Micromonospora sp. b486 TaxID=3053986 RepID=UPI00338EE02F